MEAGAAAAGYEVQWSGSSSRSFWVGDESIIRTLYSVAEKTRIRLSLIISHLSTERLSQYIYDNAGRDLCACLFRDSFHRPVSAVFENKGRLLHNQLGVSV